MSERQADTFLWYKVGQRVSMAAKPETRPGDVLEITPIMLGYAIAKVQVETIDEHGRARGTVIEALSPE